jgi:fibronectin type 3 domain-containing protein
MSQGKRLGIRICLSLLFGMSLVGTIHAQTGHGQTLTWAESSSVAGFNVYRGTVTGGPYVKLNTSLIVPLTYFDNTGKAGTKYFYVVTAVDSVGAESANSNEVSGTAIGPPPPPTLSITSATLTVNPDGTETALVKFTDAPNQAEVVLFFDGAQKLLGQRIIAASTVSSFAQNLTVPSGTAISVSVCNSVGACSSAQAM